MCSSFALVSSFNFSHAPLTCIQTASISSRSSYVGFHLDDSMQEIIKEIVRLKLMKYRPEILDEIMFYILERPHCEEDTEEYLEHIIKYCKKDYQRA